MEELRPCDRGKRGSFFAVFTAKKAKNPPIFLTQKIVMNSKMRIMLFYKIKFYNVWYFYNCRNAIYCGVKNFQKS